MHDFDYTAPSSLQEAFDFIDEHGAASRFLAGGTDLIDQIRTRRHTPEWVVDVKKIPELNVLEVNSSGLRLGAAVPCYKIYQHPEISKTYGALADSSALIGSVQIQNRASVGGNLCNSGPAGDSIPALIALNAECVIASSKGERTVPVAEFCTGPGKNVLEPGEVLVELRLPAPGSHAASNYRRFIPRNEMDIAVVGVGAAVELDEKGETIVSARIGLGAVAATPLWVEAAGDILAGQPVSEEVITKAGQASRELAQPIDDMRGTVEFRLHVSEVLTKRALWEAIKRAQSNS